MQPEHIHNHLRLCLSSRRFYELTEMLGMQPELLCPRRSRFAPKTPAFRGEIRNTNIEIRKKVGYVKEQSCLKGKR